jgi:hypothetical protein
VTGQDRCLGLSLDFWALLKQLRHRLLGSSLAACAAFQAGFWVLVLHWYSSLQLLTRPPTGSYSAGRKLVYGHVLVGGLHFHLNFYFLRLSGCDSLSKSRWYPQLVLDILLDIDLYDADAHSLLSR